MGDPADFIVMVVRATEMRLPFFSHRTKSAMTAYEYMQKQARGLAGGLAWSEHVFKNTPRYTEESMLDAAVDIAWERLLSNTTLQKELVIERRLNMLFFRAQQRGCAQAINQAA